MLFGVISPKIKVITVTTMVETVAAKSGWDLMISVNNKVAIVAAAILLFVWPIVFGVLIAVGEGIVVINLS